MDGIINAIKDALADFFQPILDFVLTAVVELLAPLIGNCRDFGDKFFSGFVGKATQVLCQTPEQWNSDGWAFIMETVNNVFIAFGCSLVVVFFLIGFISESLDPRHDVRIETIMKALFKILLAEWLVCYSADIITGFFGFVSDLTNGYANVNYKMPEWTVMNYYNADMDIVERIDIYDLEAITSMGFGYVIFTLLFAFVYMIIMMGSGAIIAYTAYMRFFKIMLIVPYGSLVSSTVAGNGALSHTAMQYYKYVLSVVLEAVTIIIAIGLFSKIMAGNQFNFINAAELNFEKDAYMMVAFINRSLAGILLVGAVKGAGALTQKLLSA